MILRTASGTRWRIDFPARTRARISVADTSMRVTGTERAFTATPGSTAAGASPARAITATVAKRAIPSGSFQLASCRHWSTPISRTS